MRSKYLKNKKNVLFLTVIGIISILMASAFIKDEDPFSQMLQKLEVYNKANTQEKVYLHLDKPYYAIGDDIWFKAYVVNTLTSAPSKISNSMYVELIDENQVLKSQIKIPISFGIGWGDFNLPDSLTEGNYRIRAYTQWMRNAGTEYFFDKVIKIGNSRPIATNTQSGKAKASKTATPKSITGPADIQFFPEGGYLVENIPSKIAVKAINTRGLGEDVLIVVKDQTGEELVREKTQHFGMGSFILNPQPGHTYTASVTMADGSEKNIPLPKAQSTGYILAVNNKDTTKLGIKVMISESFLGNGELKLLVQHNNNIFYSAKFKTEKQLLSLSLPTEKIPSGILHLTLFNTENMAVCERLVFIRNTTEQVNLEIEQPIVNSSRMAKMTTSFKASRAGTPITGSFSVAITNTAKIKPDEQNESNIFTSLLLTSDLAGYVEKPNYYFLKDDKETRDNLDLLMLTQGWSRFIWKDFLNGNPKQVAFPAEKLPNISGTVTTYSGKPVIKGKVFLFASSGKIFALDTLTDDKGHFNFDNLSYTDSIRFMVKAQTETGKPNVQIKIDVQPGQLITKNKNTADIELNVNESISAYLKNNNNYLDELAKMGLLKSTINLNTVDIVAKRNIITRSANLNGPGQADAVITAKDLENSLSLIQYLEGRYSGITYNMNGTVKTPYLTRTFFSSATSASPPSPMSILLDGIPTDAEILQSLTVADVESVEILKSTAYTFIYGSNNGAIIINTKTGKSNRIVNTPGIIVHSPQGYYTGRVFYVPKYEASTSNPPDYRSTIFWKPNIISDKEGKASFEYSNANEPGTYRVVLEGIDAFGSLARKVYQYEVK